MVILSRRSEPIFWLPCREASFPSRASPPATTLLGGKTLVALANETHPVSGPIKGG